MAGTHDTRPLHGTSERPLLAGVCLWLGRRLGVDALVVRVAFLAGTLLGGLAVPIYAVLCLVAPGEESERARRVRAAVGLEDGRGARTSRGAAEVALGAGLLALAALFTLRATGLWLSDAITWPVALLAIGGVLIWRTSLAPSPPAGGLDEAPRDSPRARPQTAERAAEAVRRRAAWAATAASRTGVGVALVLAAALVFLQATGALGAARDVALAAVVVAVALAIIFAPWILRLVRSLDTERAERIRSQERAEVAAHLHDSVLQTLALMQKRADDPAQVATLARRQERELRAWLSGRRQDTEAGAQRCLAAAVEAAAGEIEEAHGATVEVVAVGDLPLDERGEALVAAVREAMLNAARHGGGEVSVYAEASDGHATVFVRDRGPGFDPSSVPADRRGISESIIGRMARHGGRAVVHARPGEGTEVELTTHGAAP